MAYCYTHSYEHDFLGNCPHCSLEEEIREQSRVNERISREQINAREEIIQRQTQAQLRAMEEDAERREELHYEALAEQQRIAEDAIFEQQRIAEETISAQRHNIANAWRLESQAKVDQAFEMLNAEMYKESLDLAQQAIGEKGNGGDVGNILGHLVAGSSLLVLGKSNEAEKYFYSQIKLLATSDYQNNVQIHQIVFEALPKTDEFLSKFSLIVLQNAVNWELSQYFLGFVEEFVKHNLTDEAKNLARICINKAESCFLPLGLWGIVHRLHTLNLNEEKILAARVAIKNTPKMLANKSEFANVPTLLRGLIMDNLLVEAKQLSEVAISQTRFIINHILRQEILYRMGQTFDDWLKQFLNSIQSSERNTLYPELEAVFGSDSISPATLAFVKEQLSERYQQWVTLIEEELKVEVMRQKDEALILNVALMIWAFVSSILCFPIGLIVNTIWAFKIFRDYQKLEKKKTAFQLLAELECKKWTPFVNRNIQFSLPVFSLNVVEIVGLSISAFIAAFILLLVIF